MVGLHDFAHAVSKILQPITVLGTSFLYKYGGKHYDLPSAAFEGDTLYLLYDGMNLYFPADRKGCIIDAEPANYALHVATRPEGVVVLDTAGQHSFPASATCSATC